MRKNIDVVRFWKDEEYRNSLSESERASVPENPAGMMDLEDQDLRQILGGHPTHCFASTGCCSGLTDASCVLNCSTCPDDHTEVA